MTTYEALFAAQLVKFRTAVLYTNKKEIKNHIDLIQQINRDLLSSIGGVGAHRGNDNVAHVQLIVASKETKSCRIPPILNILPFHID